uniref:UBA domain-containing protein n=1 Tax=Aureoumbra lagunensis TaxID=44058 RepID=A0A7S3K1G6_9STRA|eukprot:CAMPEP_0197317054 /NCGR_PEP_ID=MMETSP0891-20130614/45507_1 /TAXON_ID=44058 ORGANISM="Aureoumbra lagunensis, Strain CCMP1510" /NCGR_SAMPLE_ID=MMETSP0891 /ASSEMBLY_ACC=CAM_ASM_000534 /LENGTH=412 /DNA_ID=CAMNT_0042806847 /DNA_START=6 /DNA_END=1244 /DNA_ORIENTATION=-
MKFVGRLGGGSRKRDEEDLRSLVAMGFDRSAALTALQASGGRLERAIERLTTQQSAPAQPVKQFDRDIDIDREVEALVSDDSEAARCLLTVLIDVAASPSGNVHRVLPIKGNTPIPMALAAGNRAGERVLKAVGYQVHTGSGTLALTKYNADQLVLVKASLERAVTRLDTLGISSTAQELNAVRKTAQQNRKLVAASFAGTNEPQGVGAMLVFVLPSGVTIRRKFDSDHTLDKVIRFLATVDDTPPDFNDRGSWRVLVDGPAPAWWCDAWSIVDADNPSRTFQPEHAFQTLNHLGLWPSATLRIQDSSTNMISFSSSSSQQKQKAPSLTSATKPKPSELIRRVENRFDQQPLSSISGTRKQHFNVAKSVDKVPGLAQLIGMGFTEDNARSALRASDGNLQRALDTLLRGASS